MPGAQKDTKCSIVLAEENTLGRSMARSGRERKILENKKKKTGREVPAGVVHSDLFGASPLHPHMSTYLADHLLRWNLPCQDPNNIYQRVAKRKKEQ